MLTTHALARVGVVVADLDRAITNYERIYGITEWEVCEHSPAGQESYGRILKETPGSWRSAVGTTPAAGEEDIPLTFELIQPISGESPFMEHLRTKREGICFLRVVASGAATPEEHFAALGIPVVYRADGRVFFDTRQQLGGFLLEMVTQDSTVPSPAGPALLPAQKMYHFGVVVHNVLEAVEQYRRIFGVSRFDCKTWERAEGRLDDPQYRGEKVDHGYFTAQTFPGNFGFEIIQCNHGPSHYNREFFDIRGPGIHHIFPWMTTEEQQWEEMITTMTDAGYPLCMGSPLRGGAAEFGYFDTVDALGGYLVEVVLRSRPAPPEYQAPDWVIDYQELP